MAEQPETKSPEGSLCWIEIPVRDIEKVKGFYSALFPSWDFKPLYTYEESNTTVYMYNFEKPAGLTGGIVQMPKECGECVQAMGSGFTNYYLVHSVDEAVKKVENLGGSVVLSKQKQGEHGFFVMFKDIEGNRFGVYEWFPSKAA